MSSFRSPNVATGAITAGHVVNATGTDITATGTVVALGIADVGCAIGGRCVIHHNDKIVNAISASAITAGTAVSASTLGKLKTAVTNDICLGIAMTAATGADEVIEVLTRVYKV